MIKRIFNKEDIENLYLQDGQTVKSVAKYFKTNTTRITKILNESTNEHVLNKKSHPNKGKKIPKPKRHQGKVCEICGDDNGIRYSKEINKCLCSKHYQQVYLYGRILERTYFDKNDLIEHDEFIEIILRDKNCDDVGIALVSIEHLEKIKKHKWHLRSDGYVECRINKKIMLLHRFVTNAKSEEYVDHIDRNKLNNLDSNLRIVCCSENGVNKGLMSNNTSFLVL
jgi:hypothetical protein